MICGAAWLVHAVHKIEGGEIQKREKEETYGKII